jgi:hypothetical protein
VRALLRIYFAAFADGGAAPERGGCAVREVTAHEEGTIAKEGVAVRTGGGRTVVGVAAYMDHVLALGPDAFASLAPEISCLSSRKQTQKAHELTLQWLDTCLQRLPRVRRWWWLVVCSDQHVW